MQLFYVPVGGTIIVAVCQHMKGAYLDMQNAQHILEPGCIRLGKVEAY